MNYATQDGTAIANQDYKAVSGTLNFSGISYRTFTVPLTASANQQKTILLVLTP